MSTPPTPRDLPSAADELVVLVIDDDEVARSGVEGSLRTSTAPITVIGMGVREALGRTFERIHAAVVECVDPTHPTDQVVAPSVIEHLARVGPAGLRTVAVCSVVDDDPIRRRLAECGASRYLHRSWARRPADLLRAVLDDDAPDLAVPAVADPEALQRLGIGPASSVNRGVEAAIALGLVPATGWVGPRGRDRYARRIRFNQEARLRPVTAEGLDSDHGELTPSMRQIQRFHAWAARVVPPASTPDDRPHHPHEHRPAPRDTEADGPWLRMGQLVPTR